MTARNQVTLSQVSDYFHIEIEIVSDFADFGLFPTVSLDGEIGIETDNLGRLEEILNLYQSLGINKEGIEVVLNMRERISALQGEVERLRNVAERLKYHIGNEDPELLKRRGLLIEIDD